MSTTLTAFKIRPAAERGKTEIGWLHGRHSFSFGRYYDPQNLGYRSLRVINDDFVEPARGFGEHGHDNMEILTWVLEGTLRHQDSTGTNGQIRPGELQHMSAGRGILHSEMNDSPSERVHLLQIWIEPDTLNLTPAYSQKAFPRDARKGRWQILASPDGHDDSLRIRQDAILSVAELGNGQRVDISLADDRHAYVHVAYGAARVGEKTLTVGDALTISGPASLNFTASEESQILYFDLA